MTRLHYACIATVTASVLAGCGTSFQPPGFSNDSGINGTVLVQPNCPPQAASSQDCSNQPLAADVVVIDSRNGVPVATFSTGADGKFQVTLAPGEYILDPQPGPTGLPFAHRQMVQVKAGEFTPILILYQSSF